MVVLERIMEMKKQGTPTSQIIQTLKEQGISPKEINEALSQSEIKSEISNDPAINPQQTPIINQNQQPPATQPAQTSALQDPFAQTKPANQEFQPQEPPQNTAPTNKNPQEGMQPSMKISSHEETYPNQAPGAQPSNITEPQSPNPQDYVQEFQQPTQEYPEYQSQEGPQGPVKDYAQEQYEESYYPEYDQQYEPPQAMDVETINDIASQIVDERTRKLKEEISQFTKFRKESDNKIKDIEKRLEKIENTIEQLQTAVIRKIGDYGEDIKNISKEMKASQNSFSKILDPLTDNIRELQHITGNLKATPKKPKEEKIQTETPQTSRKRKRQEPSFEDYLR